MLLFAQPLFVSSNLGLDKIYKYNTDGGQWDEMPTTMSEAKYLMTAIKIKRSIFKACNSGKIPVETF